MRFAFATRKTGDSAHHKMHHGHKHHTYADRAAMDIHKVLADPPATWQPYMDVPGGLMKIIEMEYGEAKAAYMAMKNETGTHHEFTHELCHLMAAVALAHGKMTCED